MSKTASEDVLGELHNALATVLTDSVKEKECSAAVLAVAAKFLKDNSITCAPSADNKMGELESALGEKAKSSAALMPQELKDALDNLGGVKVS